MKKNITSALLIIGFVSLVIISCQEKKNDSITPTYRSESTSTGANPNIKMVKKTTTLVSPTSQNSDTKHQ